MKCLTGVIRNWTTTIPLHTSAGLLLRKALPAKLAKCLLFASQKFKAVKFRLRYSLGRQWRTQYLPNFIYILC